jgi:hypothetical protein
MSKHLHQFYEKTKNVHIGLCVALLFILIFIVAPLNLGYKKTKMGQVMIVGILAYILYINFTETHNCALMEKNNTRKGIHTDGKNDDDKGKPDDGMSNNIILSYILTGFIMALLVYVVYSIL